MTNPQTETIALTDLAALPGWWWDMFGPVEHADDVDGIQPGHCRRIETAAVPPLKRQSHERVFARVRTAQKLLDEPPVCYICRTTPGRLTYLFGRRRISE